MKTKVLFFLSVILLSTINIFAQKIEIDGLYYYLNSTEKTAEVTHHAYPGHYSGDIFIPNIINYVEDDYVVASLESNAFWYCDITSIIVPNSIIYIGESAFSDCKLLTDVVIQNGITKIGENAFSGCKVLTSIIIPNGVIGIEARTFFGCYILASVVLPSSIRYLKQEAFMVCQKLNAITNLNPIPVDVSSSTNIFHDVNITECALIVPTSAVTAYQNAAIWQDFNIVGGGILVNPTVNNNLWGYTDGNALYSSGETATVTATARYSCNFVNWTVNGEVVSTEETYSFTVTDDIELVANFEQHTNNINVTINNPDYGTVTGAGSYPLNSTATLTAHAKTGFKFVNWIKDDVEIYDNPYSFTVTKNEELIVNFREKYNYTVSLTINNPTFGTINGAGTYMEDEWVYLSAIANAGYYFSHWAEDGEIISYDKYYNFRITEDTKLLAIFIVNDWGIDDIEKVDIIIYPNPTNGGLTINNEQLEIREIEVFSLMGKKQNILLDNQLVKYVLDISHLPAGMYIIRIMTKEDMIVKKILKM